MSCAEECPPSIAFSRAADAAGSIRAGLVAAWLGAQLSALTEGLATLAIVALVAIGFPQVQRFRISQRKNFFEPTPKNTTSALVTVRLVTPEVFSSAGRLRAVGRSALLPNFQSRPRLQDWDRALSSGLQPLRRDHSLSSQMPRAEF